MEKCPCCGYDTLGRFFEGRGNYEICDLCNWEDDPNYNEHYPDEVGGGANSKYSLTEARQNFKKHLIMFDEKDSRFKQSKIRIEAKKNMINAFEWLKASSSKEERQILRKIIENNKQILDQELKWRINEDEKKAIEERKKKGVPLQDVKVSISEEEKREKEQRELTILREASRIKIELMLETEKEYCEKALAACEEAIEKSFEPRDIWLREKEKVKQRIVEIDESLKPFRRYMKKPRHKHALFIDI